MDDSAINEILNNQKRLQEKMEKIENHCHLMEHHDIHTTKTYSEVLKSDRLNNGKQTKLLNKQMEVFLLYSTDEKITSYDLRQILYDRVKPTQLGIGIDKIRNIGGGGVAVEIGNKEEADRFEQFIVKEVSNIIIKKPKKKLPHLVIYSVPSEITREELSRCIYNQNDRIGEIYSEVEFIDNFRVKFRMGKRGKYYNNWVIQATPKLRLHLLKIEKISVQWSKCRISDFYPVLQCFRCCRFGHSSTSCSQEASTCSHCAGQHNFKDCTNKNKPAVCCNCKHDNPSNCGHNARDSICKVYNKIKNNIIQRTDYGTSY
ncbi:uncharacterized protein LOC111618966 [Centruroides sculpturatus]|uniref:uncharacterized protein LOC111618966 n=1 Tax=Centruroides sculpturatus TaxID=218467 RepID=UPI000C6C8ADA|nr:uncharacterized protein LOC111618966 [Centruroides sculpturatus]